MTSPKNVESDSERGEPDQDYTLKARPWLREVTPWSYIVSHPYPGEGTLEKPFAVDWLPSTPEGFVDVENPKHYPARRRWRFTVTAGLLTLCVSVCSSMLSAAVREIAVDFSGYSSEAYGLVTSGFVAGFIVGPFLWAPLSELYGRRRIFLLTYPLFTLFNALVCSSVNLEMLLVLRFLAGTFGASAMTNSGGVIADMFSAENRGLALALYATAIFAGPSIGPIVGGFLGQYRGWKWVAGLLSFLSLSLCLAGSLIPETNSPVLLRRRAARLSKRTGKVYRYRVDGATVMKPKEVFRNALKRPWRLVFGELIVAVFAAYFSVVYALLYMQFTSFPIVFQLIRGWSPSISGLAFLGITAGAVLSLLFIVFWENPRYARLLRERGGYVPPEQRLVGTMAGAWLVPIGLIIFAWTCSPPSIHWIVPILATVPFGAGLVVIFLGGANYLVDSYLRYAASVLAGNTVCRSIFGVVFPLFTARIYQSLGVNRAGTLIAGLSFLFAPVPMLLFKYGERIRLSSEISREADELGKKLAKAVMKQKAAAKRIAEQRQPESSKQEEQKKKNESAREKHEEVEQQQEEAVFVPPASPPENGARDVATESNV